MPSLSPRLAAIVDALPLRPGMRVLEIGCGPGVAAREVARRLRGGYVLGIERSQKAITLARAGSKAEPMSGQLSFRCVAIEDFQLSSDDSLFDLAFAIRVGALDGVIRTLSNRPAPASPRRSNRTASSSSTAATRCD